MALLVFSKSNDMVDFPDGKLRSIERSQYIQYISHRVWIFNGFELFAGFVAS